MVDGDGIECVDGSLMLTATGLSALMVASMVVGSNGRINNQL